MNKYIHCKYCLESRLAQCKLCIIKELHPDMEFPSNFIIDDI